MVTWTAPSSNGGSPITGYTVTAADSTNSSHGGETCPWTTGPLTCTLTGLTNGDSYTFTVTAKNANGTGPASAPSSPVIVGVVPGQPTGVAATAGNANAVVTWTAPSSNGGSAITSYTVTALDSTNSGRGGETCTWTTGPLTCTVTGLTNGDSYTFEVAATNWIGEGLESTPSTPVTPATVPDAPTIGTATGANASAKRDLDRADLQRWQPDHRLHGDRLRLDHPSNGGETCTWTSGPLSCTVNGLTNGDSYTFSVTATNGGRDRPRLGSPSNSVIPMPVPGAPSASRPPTGRTGAPRLPGVPRHVQRGFAHHRVHGDRGRHHRLGKRRRDLLVDHRPLTCTVTGLTNGDTYTFRVTAKNGSAPGLPRLASNSVTPTASCPALRPSAPPQRCARERQASPGAAPISNGGSPITSYTVTAIDSTNSGNGEARPAPGRPVLSPARSPGSPTVTPIPSPSPPPTASGPVRLSAASNSVTPATVARCPDHRHRHNGQQRERQA